MTINNNPFNNVTKTSQGADMSRLWTYIRNVCKIGLTDFSTDSGTHPKA